MGTVRVSFERYGKLNIVNIYIAKGAKVKHHRKLLPTHIEVLEYAAWLNELYYAIGFTVLPMKGLELCLI